MAKVIALFNQSGGAGKSTLTMNLGYHLAKRDLQVLLVDMDPQGSLTIYMGLEPAEMKQTIVDSILEDKPLAIHRQINDMDLVPANILLSEAEPRLLSALAREQRLRDTLKPILPDYDFILLDGSFASQNGVQSM